MKKTSKVKAAIAGFAAGLGMAVAVPAVGAEMLEHECLGPENQLSHAEMESLRGGFIGEGLRMAFAYERMTVINGELRVHETIYIPGIPAPTGRGAFQLDVPALIAQNSPSDPAMTDATVLTDGMLTIIENHLDNQTIENLQIFHIELDNFGDLKDASLAQAVTDSLIDTLATGL